MPRKGANDYKKISLTTKLILAIGLVMVVGLGVGVIAITTKSGADTNALSFREGEQFGFSLC